MFRLFGKQETPCPISEDVRLWIENSLIWLINQFSEEKILNSTVLLPVPEHFPINFNGTEQVAYDCLDIVAQQMDVNPKDIVLRFYTEQLLEIQSDTGFTLFGQQYEDENYSSGLYEGKNEDGKFQIALESAQLKEPDKLVATLAHEIAHIKILGEQRLEENDEYLTDLVTVFFGLGVFNANAAVKFYTSFDRWAYSKQGYLSQQEWGYALAVHAYIRSERDPDWMQYLTPNIQSDFKKSSNYIYANTDKVLV